MKAFKAKVPRFKALRRCGVRTDRLLRTGGTAALTFGLKGLGVANSMLLAQRRAAVAMTCDKPCGADLDLSLTIADGDSPGAADPAFEAHVGVMHFWAMAVWESWAPVKLLQVAICDAKKRLRGAKSVWAHVKGPAAALVATAQRLGWQVHTATQLLDDSGREVNLTLDSPCMVKGWATEAVWRWRAISRKKSWRWHRRRASAGPHLH